MLKQLTNDLINEKNVEKLNITLNNIFDLLLENDQLDETDDVFNFLRYTNIFHYNSFNIIKHIFYEELKYTQLYLYNFKEYELDVGDTQYIIKKRINALTNLLFLYRSIRIPRSVYPFVLFLIKQNNYYVHNIVLLDSIYYLVTIERMI